MHATRGMFYKRNITRVPLTSRSKTIYANLYGEVRGFYPRMGSPATRERKKARGAEEIWIRKYISRSDFKRVSRRQCTSLRFLAAAGGHLCVILLRLLRARIRRDVKRICTLVRGAIPLARDPIEGWFLNEN